MVYWLASTNIFTLHTPNQNETGIKFKTKDYKLEFVRNGLEYTNTKKII